LLRVTALASLSDIYCQVELDEEGYVRTFKNTATSVPGGLIEYYSILAIS